jgi:hypothetical protein
MVDYIYSIWMTKEKTDLSLTSHLNCVHKPSKKKSKSLPGTSVLLQALTIFSNCDLSANNPGKGTSNHFLIEWMRKQSEWRKISRCKRRENMILPRPTLSLSRLLLACSENTHPEASHHLGGNP